MNAAADWLARHRKLIVYIAGAALTLSLQVWGPDNQWVSLAIVAATGLGIYQAPNRPAPGPEETPPQGRHAR